MIPGSDNSPSFFPRTNFRNKAIPVGITQADRLSHTYVIGKTGTGKSTLLETLALQDILHGRGMMLIDPQGDLAERVMPFRLTAAETSSTSTCRTRSSDSGTNR
jgi:hypothetical protein